MVHLLPAVAYDAVIEPGDLVHCDVGLSSLGLRTDTQRNGYVLRPGETAAPDGLREALRTANRMQDLTTAASSPWAGRATRCSRRPGRPPRRKASTPTSTPTRRLPRPRRRPGDRPVGRPGRRPGCRRLPVHPDTVYALELAVRGPVPEWDGQCVRMALEEGIALTADGVEYLDGRQTELILIPGLAS